MLAAERRLGYEPRDVGDEKRGYDVESRVPGTGRLRFIGRAFGRERIGLKPQGEGKWEVYLGTLLIGELHAADPTSMRPANWERLPTTEK